MALKWKCLGKMRPMCLSNNESGMSLDTRKLILDFRDTVIIVTPGFQGMLAILGTLVSCLLC